MMKNPASLLLTTLLFLTSACVEDHRPEAGREKRTALELTVQTAQTKAYISTTTFPDGSQGYLPAAVEVCAWVDNKTAINACMDAIGGDQVGVSTWSYTWTSKQYSSYVAQNWYYSFSNVNYNLNKDYNRYVRTMCAFEI